MNNTSTILLDKKVINMLKKAKEHPRETYNELIEVLKKKGIAYKFNEIDQDDYKLIIRNMVPMPGY